MRGQGVQARVQRPAFITLPCALQILKATLHVDAVSFL